MFLFERFFNFNLIALKKICDKLIHQDILEPKYLRYLMRITLLRTVAIIVLPSNKAPETSFKNVTNTL